MSAIVSGRVYWTEFKELCYTNKNKKKISVKETTAKIVMLAIADSADDFGENSWNSFETLATKTSILRRSVIRVARALINNNYLKIAGVSRYGTNNFSINLALLGQPPLKRATNGRPKTGDSVAITGVPESKSGDSESKSGDPQTPYPSYIPPVSPLNNGLTEEEIKQANAKVTAMIENGKKTKYQNRDKLPEPYLVFADLYNELTGQEPTKRSIFDWMSTFEDWKTEGLQPEHIRAAYQYATRPDGGFPVGRPGALTNTAVAMKSKMIGKTSSAPQVDEAAVKETLKMVEEKFSGKFVPRPANVQRPQLKG